jgi:ABC-2 type transport system ATP-binding protein
LTAIATLYMPLGSFTRSEFYSTARYGTFRGAAGRPWKRFEILGAAMTEIRDNKGIEVEGLVREFKNGPRAVDGIDLNVAAGEIYGFLGPNGAGKSTTVLMLTTLLPPTAGTARVAGFDIVSEGPLVRASIGAALQEAALDPLLTGREHMRLQTALHGLPKDERNSRGQELLDRVGLAEAADRKVGGYSGGMKRRLDLALALVHRPRILFLDEPTTGLDIQSRTALWDEVARLAAEEGVTVFLTTQYLEEADALAGRVGIIDHGRIVAEGTPAELKAEIGRPTVEAEPRDPDDQARVAAVLERFGPSAGASPRGAAARLEGGESQLAEVVRALDAEGIAIERLQLHAPSLDDVFLAKTGRSLEGAGDAEEADTGEAEVVEA